MATRRPFPPPIDPAPFPARAVDDAGCSKASRRLGRGPARPGVRSPHFRARLGHGLAFSAPDPPRGSRRPRGGAGGPARDRWRASPAPASRATPRCAAFARRSWTRATSAAGPRRRSIAPGPRRAALPRARLAAPRLRVEPRARASCSASHRTWCGRCRSSSRCTRACTGRPVDGSARASGSTTPLSLFRNVRTHRSLSGQAVLQARARAARPGPEGRRRLLRRPVRRRPADARQRALRPPPRRAAASYAAVTVVREGGRPDARRGASRTRSTGAADGPRPRDRERDGAVDRRRPPARRARRAAAAAPHQGRAHRRAAPPRRQRGRAHAHLAARRPGHVHPAVG